MFHKVVWYHMQVVVGFLVNFNANLLQNFPLNKLWKSVKIWQNYRREFATTVLMDQSVYIIYYMLYNGRLLPVEAIIRLCWPPFTKTVFVYTDRKKAPLTKLMTVCRRSLLYPRRLSLCQPKLASCNWCAVFITRTGCAAHGCMRRLCSSALSSWVHRRDTTRVHRTDLTLICKQAVCRRNRTELTTSSKLRTLDLTNYEVLRGSARRQSV